MTFTFTESYAAIATLHDFLCLLPGCDQPVLLKDGEMPPAELERHVKNTLVFFRDRAPMLDWPSAIVAQVAMEGYLGAGAGTALRRIWERSPMLADVAELRSLLVSVVGKIQKGVAAAEGAEKL